MNKEQKRERNKDIVQLKKIGYRMLPLCGIFKMTKENLVHIVNVNWEIYAYPSQEEIKSIEVRRNINIGSIISINDNGKLVELGLS